MLTVIVEGLLRRRLRLRLQAADRAEEALLIHKLMRKFNSMPFAGDYAERSAGSSGHRHSRNDQ